jgi:hypothetical protein
MKCRTLIAGLVSCAFVIGCDEQNAPTETLAPDFVVAGSSGCYTVKFTDDLVAAAPTVLLGQLGGDLEGTTQWVADAGSIKFAGNTMHVKGIVTYNITGGIVPELVDESFTATGDWVNVWAPPGEPTVNNEGTLRALDGVAKANVTFHGHTVLASATSFLKFQGVICT